MAASLRPHRWQPLPPLSLTLSLPPSFSSPFLLSFLNSLIWPWQSFSLHLKNIMTYGTPIIEKIFRTNCLLKYMALNSFFKKLTSMCLICSIKKKYFRFRFFRSSNLICKNCENCWIPKVNASLQLQFMPMGGRNATQASEVSMPHAKSPIFYLIKDSTELKKNCPYSINLGFSLLHYDPSAFHYIIIFHCPKAILGSFCK